MDVKERFLKTIQNQNTERPLFCPALYNYKANFTETAIQDFGQDKDDMAQAIEKEIEVLHPEIVTCGFDIYNVEAEALGAKVNHNIENMMPEIEQPLLQTIEQVKDLPILNGTEGRMKMFVDITKNIHSNYGDSVYSRGAVSGPFSLAGALYAKDNLFMDCIIAPDKVSMLLDFCTKIIINYVNEYIKQDLPVVVFDSLASPPLVSPELYKDLIYPFHKKLFQFMKKSGMEIRPLIMGGDTREILPYLVQTGANQLLIDFSVSLADAIQIIENNQQLAFRINIDPSILVQGNKNLIQEKVNELVKMTKSQQNVLLGTGILMENTPIENILYVDKLIKQQYI